MNGDHAVQNEINTDNRNSNQNIKYDQKNCFFLYYCLVPGNADRYVIIWRLSDRL